MSADISIKEDENGSYTLNFKFADGGHSPGRIITQQEEDMKGKNSKKMSKRRAVKTWLSFGERYIKEGGREWVL